jgi:hypothetical protein
MMLDEFHQVVHHSPAPSKTGEGLHGFGRRIGLSILGCRRGNDRFPVGWITKEDAASPAA